MYNKIGKAEFKCPHWFSTDVKRLLQRILDPNLSTRISMEKIMENPWFRKGLNAKLLGYNSLTKDAPPMDMGADFDSVNTIATIDNKKQEESKPINLNAFDIISLSTSLDLSGMFEESDKRKSQIHVHQHKLDDHIKD
jgi:hypothetical protein